MYTNFNWDKKVSPDVTRKTTDNFKQNSQSLIDNRNVEQICHIDLSSQKTKNKNKKRLMD